MTKANKETLTMFLKNIKNLKLKKELQCFFEKDVQWYLIILDKIFSEKNESISVDVVNRLKDLNDHLIIKAEGLANKIDDRRIQKSFRDCFRDMVGVWFYKSDYFKKSLIKPRGYPGDFEMMEIIYNYSLSSDGVVGKYFDQYYLDSPYAQAVRNRRVKMIDILNDLIDSANKEELDFFNIACGPSRELRELFNKKKEFKAGLNITCFDHDQEALDYSKMFLKKLPKNVNLNFLKGDVLSYIRNLEKSKKILKEYDLVYSMGLADYLPDNLFRGMIKFAFSLLKRKGKFVIAHKIEDNDPFAPFTPKWVCEWVFNKRNVEDLLRLIKTSGIEGYSLGGYEWDATYRVIFITISKK